MKSYFDLATDPLQYDSEKMDWKKEGVAESTARSLEREYYDKNIDVEGKDVIDIGCGMGLLFPTLLKNNSKSIFGIDPSSRNIETCKKKYPSVKTEQSTLEGFSSESKFNVAIATFVFEHIGEVDKAFSKISSLIQSGGYFYMAHVDISYGLTPRFDYGIDFQKVDEYTTAARTKRSVGVMYDLLRPVSFYIESAKKAGLAFQKEVEIKVTDDYVKDVPKYVPFLGTSIGHLLSFKKN